MTDNGMMRQKIAALEEAVASAQATMEKAIQELTEITTAFPSPENEAIKKYKGRLGVVAKNWDDACRMAKAELKKLLTKSES